MKHSLNYPRTFCLFHFKQKEYFLLEVTARTAINIVVAAYRGEDLEWARKQPFPGPVTFKAREETYGLEDFYSNAPPYLEVNVLQKYYFPTFAKDYQMYDLEEIDMMAAVLKECIRLAGELGVVLG